MQRKLPSTTHLENLKRAAKRWLQALRENDLEAPDRFKRAYPNHSGTPVLRDVQYALAREHGLKAGRNSSSRFRKRRYRKRPRRSSKLHAISSTPIKATPQRLTGITTVRPASPI